MNILYRLTLRYPKTYWIGLQPSSTIENNCGCSEDSCQNDSCDACKECRETYSWSDGSTLAFQAWRDTFPTSGLECNRNTDGFRFAATPNLSSFANEVCLILLKLCIQPFFVCFEKIRYQMVSADGHGAVDPFIKWTNYT